MGGRCKLVRRSERRCNRLHARGQSVDLLVEDGPSALHWSRRAAGLWLHGGCVWQWPRGRNCIRFVAVCKLHICLHLQPPKYSVKRLDSVCVEHFKHGLGLDPHAVARRRFRICPVTRRCGCNPRRRCALHGHFSARSCCLCWLRLFVHDIGQRGDKKCCQLRLSHCHVFRIFCCPERQRSFHVGWRTYVVRNVYTRRCRISVCLHDKLGK